MKDSSRRYYTLVVATLGFVALGLSLFSYPTISTFVSQQFGLSNTESGLLTSAFALTYTIVQIPAGILSDRIGGAKTLFLSLAVVTLAPLLFVFGGNYGSALVSRAVAGVGAGMILPASIRLLSSSFPEKELQRAMGILGTGWGGSQILAYALLPVLILGQDWHPPLEFTVIFSLVVTLLAILPTRWLTRRVSPTPRVHVNVKGLLTVRLFALVSTNFTSLVVTVGILSWTPSFLTTSVKLGQVDAGRLVAIIGIIAILSSFAGGVLSQKFGAKPVILVSMLLLAGIPYLLATSNSWTSALFWLSMLGVGGNLYFGPVMALVPYSSKQGLPAAGISFGIFNTLSNVGNFISPIIIGYALDLTGSFLIGFTALGVIGIMGVAGALLIRGDRAPAVPPSE